MWLNAVFQSIIMREKHFCRVCSRKLHTRLHLWYCKMMKQFARAAGMLFCKYKVAEKRYTWQSVSFIKMTHFLWKKKIHSRKIRNFIEFWLLFKFQSYDWFSGWLRLTWVDSGWLELTPVDFSWLGLTQVDLGWLGLTWVDLGWLGLTWVDLGWLS